MIRLVRKLKSKVVPAGRRPLRIVSGAFRGLRLAMDLRHSTLVWLGLFEREIQGHLLRLTNGIQSGVDLGSAEGEFTVYLIKRTTAQRVISVDGDSGLETVLWENLELNGMREAPGHTHIVGFAGGGEGGSIDSGRLVSELHGVVFVKVDVEGAEELVVPAMLKALGGTASRWIIETHSPGAEAACVAALAERGAAYRIVGQAWWRKILPEYRPASHNRWIVAATDMEV